MKRNRTMTVLFLLPATLLYLLIFLYPTIRTSIMSFFKMQNITDAVSKWEFVGIDNYKFLFGSDLFKQSLTNMFNMWLWGGIIVFTLALFFAAVLLSGMKGKSFFRAVIYLPNVVSAVAMGTMWVQYVFSARYGLLKKVFGFLGLDSLANIQWTSPDTIFYAMLIAYSFGMVGYFLLIFMAGMERIPVTFYEAATLEGAGLIRQFFSITLPLIKEIIRTNVVLWTVSSVAFFTWSQVFSPMQADNGTIMPMVYMYQSVFGNDFIVTDKNVGEGAAVGIILMVIVIIMFAISTKLLKNKKLEY